MVGLEADISILTMKMKILPWIKRNLVIILAAIIFLPVVLAYTTPLQIPTLWDILIVNIFGSFWIAVIFIVLVFFIILALGGVSIQTNLIFNAEFLLCMSLGYNNGLVAWGTLLVLSIYGVHGVMKYISSS